MDVVLCTGMQCLKRPENIANDPGAGIRGDYEPPDVDVRNWTQENCASNWIFMAQYLKVSVILILSISQWNDIG